MTDPRMKRLADLLVNYSCAVEEGEKVLIEAIDIPFDFTQTLVQAVQSAGGLPFVWLRSNQVTRALLLAGSEAQWSTVADSEAAFMQQMQCYLGVRGNLNVSELSDVPADRQKVWEKQVWKRVHQDVRVKKTRWCALRWPTPSMAQMAQKSTAAFEDFFFDVCTTDYAKMSRAMQPLKHLMEKTDRVRLLGPDDTDLSFSIKGISAIPCDGHLNIPDGEVFTAPVRDSINGIIRFNCPSLYRGFTHDNVRLVFKNGKIVEATSTATQQLNEVLDSDPGARFVGEFAIGFNPFVTQPMKDILFDEKIAGSIHLTPGQCYDEASNGNNSAVHWDLVMRQTPDVGGGKIYFDQRLVRSDGLFVVPELEGLNPANLM